MQRPTHPVLILLFLIGATVLVGPSAGKGQLASEMNLHRVTDDGAQLGGGQVHGDKLVITGLEPHPVPSSISFQGLLTDDVGEPVHEQTVRIEVALYDAASSGSRVWPEDGSESHIVEVINGVFEIAIGEFAPLEPSHLAARRWVGISVNGEPELAPRIELTAAPYAIRAGVADMALALPPGRGVVRSINNLTGLVSLTAGDNVAIMTDETTNAITISTDTGSVGAWTLSSGLFGLPAEAQSVDWMVINNSTTPQVITVTVFKLGVGPKVPVVPGPLTLTVNAGESTHNANHVGFGEPFEPGFYYEVVIERADPNVLPSVHVWEDHGNTVIPGTLIPPGSWVPLQL